MRLLICPQNGILRPYQAEKCYLAFLILFMDACFFFQTTDALALKTLKIKLTTLIKIIFSQHSIWQGVLVSILVCVADISNSLLYELRHKPLANFFYIHYQIMQFIHYCEKPLIPCCPHRVFPIIAYAPFS